MTLSRVGISKRGSGWRGAGAIGILGLGLGELAAAVAGRSLIDALGRAVVDGSPRQVVDLTVQVLRGKDKPVIRIGVGTVVIAAIAGAVAIGGGIRRVPTSTRSQAALALLGVGSLATARLLLAGQRHRHRRQNHGAQPSDWWPGGYSAPDDGLGEQPNLSSLITPTDRFYVTDVNMAAPLIDARDWRLTLHGLVARPHSLSLGDLAADAEEFDAVMVCIHNPVGGGRVGNGRWLGVRLRTLLERVDPSASADTLVTRAVDGFTTSLPLDPVRTGTWNAYVVIGLNGEPLPAEHGFPARVFVPGIYGQYTGAKWLTELEFTSGPHTDYWTPRGWPHGPVWVQPQARIDTPRGATLPPHSASIVGVAWAPPHGVASVEVRADHGSWQQADLARELAPSSWRRWHANLDLAPGTHLIEARAISRSGEVQEGRRQRPFPVGASGWHSVTVRILP